MNRIKTIVWIVTSSLVWSLGVGQAADEEEFASLKRADHSFSRFPDSVDRSVLNQSKSWLLENWECSSADVFLFRGGPQLAVCGTLDPTPSRIGAYVIGLKSDFLWIVVKNTTGATRLLLMGGGWGGNPALLEMGKGRKSSYVEALADSSQYYSLFRTPITCNQDSCFVGKKTCAIDIPKNVYPHVIQRLKAEKRKTFADLPNDDGYLDLVTGYSHQLLLRALTGDRKSADLLQDHFPFALDGAAGELVDSDRDTYRRAQKLGCLNEGQK